MLRVEKLRCELAGRELYPSEVEGLGSGGRSRETGLDGGSMRLSVSVDLDLTNDAFEKLPDSG